MYELDWLCLLHDHIHYTGASQGFVPADAGLFSKKNAACELFQSIRGRFSDWQLGQSENRPLIDFIQAEPVRNNSRFLPRTALPSYFYTHK